MGNRILLIRLQQAIRNTDTSKFSKTELEHFNKLNSDFVKVINSEKKNNFTQKDVENLLNQNFQIKEESNHQSLTWQIGTIPKIQEPYYYRLIPLPKANIPSPIHPITSFKDIPGSTEYSHHKIPHYKSIVGFYIKDGETFVLVSNWTTNKNLCRKL